MASNVGQMRVKIKVVAKNFLMFQFIINFAIVGKILSKEN